MISIILYLLFFCIGTLFGSFFTLAVYRIPLHQNITHERSYCPKCNHKLSFWDMIPIISYILLGGKCRYCKEKIRIRYLLLEVLTGIIFLLFAMSLNLSFETIEISKLVYLLIGIFYIAGLIIIAGIDKEKHTIQKSVILYETIIMAIYMIYLYVVEKTNIYRYVIYLFVLLAILIIDNIYFKKKLKNYYTFEILELSMIMAMFSYEIGYIITVILTLITIVLGKMVNTFKEKKKIVKNEQKSYYKNLPFGFYLVVMNIFTIIIINFSIMWVIK